MRSTALAMFALAVPLTVGAFQLPPGLKNSQPLPLPGNANSRTRTQAEVQFFPPGQVQVKARHPAQIDLLFRVADGLHINSHAPHDTSLIATRLAVLEGNGIRVTGVDFPAGADFSPAFSPGEKLSVYSGDFALQASVTAEPGEHLLKAELRYQACDRNACMPPRELPISVDVIAK